MRKIEFLLEYLKQLKPELRNASYISAKWDKDYFYIVRLLKRLELQEKIKSYIVGRKKYYDIIEEVK